MIFSTPKFHAKAIVLEGLSGGGGGGGGRGVWHVLFIRGDGRILI